MAYQHKIDWDGIFKGIDDDFGIAKPKSAPPKRQVTPVERITPEPNLTVQANRESLETRKLPYHTPSEWALLKKRAQSRLPEKHRCKRLRNTTALWILEGIDPTITDWQPASAFRVSQNMSGFVDLHFSPLSIPDDIDDVETWATDYVTNNSNAIEVRNAANEVIFKAVGRSNTRNPI